MMQRLTLLRLVQNRSFCVTSIFSRWIQDFKRVNIIVPSCKLSGSSNKDKGFVSSLIDNIKEEFSKNKEIEENIRKFREEARKLETSDALLEAKKKYKSFEDETKKSSQYLKEKVGILGEVLKGSEFGKQASQFSKQVTDRAARTVDAISKKSNEFSKSDAFKSVSSRLGSVKDEIDEVTNIKSINFYKAPAKLRKRTVTSNGIATEPEAVAPNNDSKNIVLHKDSSWHQKIFELKARYDDSNNLAVRVASLMFCKIGRAFSQTEASEALTEIMKIDPKFNSCVENQCIKQVQTDIAPNIIGSLSQGDLEVLRDWCHEAVYNVLIQPIKQAQALNLKYVLRVVDITDIEYLAAKILEQGPVVVVMFNTQQVHYVTDLHGNVVEGEKDKLLRVMHVWALCRDQSIADPMASWRLIDASMCDRGELFI
ncbi:hypothetical protein ACOME3_008771 [Neoechinorhynchus agilis]